MEDLQLHFSTAAADRLDTIFRLFPDVFNCLSILLRAVSADPDVGITMKNLGRLIDPTVVQRRVLETMRKVECLPPNYSVHFIEIPDRAYPPPNIAVVCYHPEPRIIIAVGYIPRRDTVLIPSPFKS